MGQLAQAQRTGEPTATFEGVKQAQGLRALLMR
jgi:hypothetical protein